MARFASFQARDGDAPTLMDIMEAGTLPLLVELLRTSTHKGKANAAYAIAWLALDPPTHTLVLEVSALPLLVALLRTGTEEGKANAARAIGWIAKVAVTCTLIVAAGSLPSLVALLRSGKMSIVIKTYVVSAIEDLAQEASTRALLVKAGALPLLVEVLSSSNPVYCKVSAVRAIEELAKEAAIRVLTVAAGALPLLVELLRSTDPPGTEETKATVVLLLLELIKEMQLEDSALRAENSALRIERDPLTEGFELLASLVGPVAKGHDVVFRLPGGERIGGSRLLLAHVSPYYERLLLGGMAEGASDVEPDPDFSSAAHITLLGQLHALGHAALPVSLNVRIELLCLAAKVRCTPSGEDGGGADAILRVFERCERALRDSLCADNCLAVLLRLKPYATGVQVLVDAAHAAVLRHLAAVLKQPEWKEFRKQYLKAALAISEDIMLKQASVNAKQAAVIAQMNRQADGSCSMHKRLRAA